SSTTGGENARNFLLHDHRRRRSRLDGGCCERRQGQQRCGDRTLHRRGSGIRAGHSRLRIGNEADGRLQELHGPGRLSAVARVVGGAFHSATLGLRRRTDFSHMRRSVRRRQPFQAMNQWGREMTDEHSAGRVASADRKNGLDRRNLLSGLTLLPLVSASLVSAPALAQTSADAGALPSWQDGPAKQAILDFVRAPTDRSSASYIPPEERIATFDQDGTLWVEHPVYTQVVYCLDRVPAVVAKKPELKEAEPFKTVLSGNREAIARLSLHDLEKILFATLTGMTTEEFAAEAKAWLATAKHPRWNRPYTELV